MRLKFVELMKEKLKLMIDGCEQSWTCVTSSYRQSAVKIPTVIIAICQSKHYNEPWLEETLRGFGRIQSIRKYGIDMRMYEVKYESDCGAQHAFYNLDGFQCEMKLSANP